MILVDEAVWPFRGRRWCHMVSDSSVEELRAFARSIGVDDRLFDGDHYDLTTEMRADALAAGAVEVAGRELVRRLRAAGLRLTPAQRKASTARP